MASKNQFSSHFFSCQITSCKKCTSFSWWLVANAALKYIPVNRIEKTVLISCGVEINDHISQAEIKMTTRLIETEIITSASEYRGLHSDDWYLLIASNRNVWRDWSLISNLFKSAKGRNITKIIASYNLDSPLSEVLSRFVDSYSQSILM